ncbi:MTH938/NDUFAF3 family protein [Neisseria sp. Dent CA1/247]|uniref:Mth938-like domain-containing protein n=1 Tax=Neisseria sp. Dent CA1/247 TaxID=2912675 RepID=UPI001FD10D3E|nr:Mth938-like domain-containing protein [Neisseria sp. Dent CA1/247]UOO77817.1 MTH938/NDUFAF3 family protein [Neisseria sp. Dent CA1/247]
MLIEENTFGGEEAAITAYSPGRLEINGQVYTEAVILKENTIEHPAKATPAEMTAEDFFQTASNSQPEVILVGTGEKQIFLHPKIAAALAAKGIGLESMSTAAACRTFMILQSEGRKVWAWLWP